MFEVDFLLCLTNAVERGIMVGWGMCPSFYAISIMRISCQLRGYEEFKVHKNLNTCNSGPEVDIDPISTPVFMVRRVLQDAL